MCWLAMRSVGAFAGWVLADRPTGPITVHRVKRHVHQTPTPPSILISACVGCSEKKKKKSRLPVCSSQQTSAADCSTKQERRVRWGYSCVERRK